jgi:hypothetical protein
VEYIYTNNNLAVSPTNLLRNKSDAIQQKCSQPHHEVDCILNKNLIC